jgi:hypothetical protein
VSQGASERITEQVTTWPGVRAGPGRRGEFAFTVKGREIGHLRGERAAYFAFPKALWRELRADAGSSRIASFPTAKALQHGTSEAPTTSTT